MEPNDSDLRELLREWKVPDAPPALESRVLKRPRSWLGVLLHGSIRVPVPVACGLAILMIGGAWRLATAGASGCSAANATAIVSKARPPIPVSRRRNDRQGCVPGSAC